MAQFTKTDTRRITFLSLLGSAATAIAPNLEVGADFAYDQAKDWLDQMESDGFFESDPTPAPSGRSDRPASRSQSSRSGSAPRGRDQARGGFNGQMRDPQGPPTDKQVGAVLKMTRDYTEDDLYDMSKQDVSNLIDDLKNS